MAFLIHSTGDHRVPVNELMPCGAIVPKVGMAMVLTGGNLAAAAGTTKPTHICMEERASACTSGELIHVIRAEADITFAAPLTADGAALKVGDKVTLSADGMGVTATTTSGVAQIAGICGTGVDDLVRVRFP